jgi:type VI secretion system Hcp family effector
MNRRPTRLTVFTLATIFVLTFLVPSIASATWAAAWITGQNQGVIKGSNQRSGLKGSIEVLTLGTSVAYPVAANGDLGTNSSSVIALVKPVDKAGPKLLQAYSAKELLTDVTIRFYRVADDGRTENYFTIELVNCRVSSLRTDTSKVARNFSPREEVGLTWETMITRDENSGITGQINW